MIYTVPTAANGLAGWSQVSSLDGVDFQLVFAWSQREGAWRLTLNDLHGAPILASVRLGTIVQLLRGVRDARRPPGELFVVDTLATGRDDPGFADLGTRFLLLYADAAELGR